ncbi:hypothetical protein ABZU76_17055 [Amycolatopsis sp. NPDC005232]
MNELLQELRAAQTRRAVASTSSPWATAAGFALLLFVVFWGVVPRLLGRR